jgi:hypothetical protein
MTDRGFAARTLHELTGAELEMADPRYPKWVTMCQLRLLGLPVLNAVLIVPGERNSCIAAAIRSLASVTGQQRLMLRSDGGIETRRYYRGGNTFLLDQLQSRVSALLNQGRAAILLEPTNRFTNQLTALLRMDRPAPGQTGQFIIEALGPGYDVADLTRGGISPQITVTAANIDWSCYHELWWSDLHFSRNQSPATEHSRKRRRLAGLAAYVLTDTGDLRPGTLLSDQAAAAEAWLRQHGHLELWQSQDIVAVIARRVQEWFDDVFLIAKCHRNPSWTCLATATSNLGSGRWIFWGIVDGDCKYGTITGRRA